MSTIRTGGRGEEERDGNWESVCHFDKSTFSNQTHTCRRREEGENGDETGWREKTQPSKKKKIRNGRGREGSRGNESDENMRMIREKKR